MNNISECKLPKWLSYHNYENLIRYGNDFDGGYLVIKDDIENCEGLISFGINDDWSFEESVLKSKQIPILCYDKSISATIFRSKILNALLKPWQLSNIFHWIKVYKSYKQFFQGSVRHIEMFIGKETRSGHYIELKDVFKRTKSNKNFLKIDIEGSEYRILEDILFHEARITGMVIEFHDVDLHLDKIRDFILNLKIHEICHIHVNNFGEIMEHQDLPQIIEITFTSSNKKLSSKIKELPHKYDSPNNPLASDYKINFV